MKERRSLVLLAGTAAAAAAAAVAIVGIALGGADSTSREDYQSAVVNARNRVDFALARLTKATSVEELLVRIDEAADVVDDTAGDLENVGVADGFADENERLARALRALASELAGTAGTLRDPAFADTLPVLTSLSFEQWVVVNRIIEDLKKKGIQVEQLPRH